MSTINQIQFTFIMKSKWFWWCLFFKFSLFLNRNANRSYIHNSVAFMRKYSGWASQDGKLKAIAVQQQYFAQKRVNHNLPTSLVRYFIFARLHFVLSLRKYKIFATEGLNNKCGGSTTNKNNRTSSTKIDWVDSLILSKLANRENAVN